MKAHAGIVRPAAAPVWLRLGLVLSLAAGLGLGWCLRSGDDAEPSSSGGVKNSATTGVVIPGRPGRPLATTTGPARTLAAVEKEIIVKGGLPAEARAAIAAMKTEELHDLMVQITKENRLPDDSSGRAWQDGLLHASAEELCRRDLPGSLDWGKAYCAVRPADSIFNFPPIGNPFHTPPMGTDCILPHLVQAASKLDATATIAWRRENGPQNWSEQQPGDVAYAAAAANGAEAMLRAEPDATGSVTLEQGFPGGFDFARLIAETEKQVTVPIASGYWAGIDPDAAWDSVREKFPGNPHLPGVLMAGMALTRGDDEAATWLCEKLKDLPQEQRLKVLQRFDDCTTSSVEAVMARLENEQERLAYVGSVLESGGSPIDPHRPDVRALELLGSEELQVQALQDYLKSGGDLRSIERSLKLSPGVIEKVKADAPILPEG